MSSLNGTDKSEPRESDGASLVAPVESTAQWLAPQQGPLQKSSGRAFDHQRVYPTVSEETADEWALRNAAASFP